MSLFLNAVKSSLSAAESIERKNAEIKGVLTAANNALKEATNGIIGLEKAHSVAGATDPFLNSLAKFLKQNTQQVLVLKNLIYTDAPAHSVAIWSDTDAVYPIQITIGNESFNCNDVKSVEGIIVKLLGMPFVGLRLKEMLNYHRLKHGRMVAKALINTSQPTKAVNALVTTFKPAEVAKSPGLLSMTNDKAKPTRGLLAYVEGTDKTAKKKNVPKQKIVKKTPSTAVKAAAGTSRKKSKV